MNPTNITLTVDNEFLENLKKQKLIILAVQSTDILPKEERDELEGVLNLFDHIQDQLSDVHGVPKSEVFDFDNDKLKELQDKIIEYNKKIMC